MVKVLCILDMRPNVHYTLERLPSIKRALNKQDSVYLNIYEFEEKFGCYCGPDKVNQKFLNFVAENKITAIFTSSEWFNFVSADTILRLTNSNVVVASVLGDDENNFHINVNYLGLLTVPVAYQKNEYKKYLTVNPNTRCMPISISMHDSDFYLSATKKNDVIFIGKAYGNRPKLLKYLCENGIKLIIYGGKEWERYFDNDVYKGYINNSDYYGEIAQSKIVLALLESQDNEELLHVNAKPFDAAKTGTALIVTRYKAFFEDYELQERSDLLAYSTKEELLLSVKELLSNDNDRQRIANSFREKIRHNYDYDRLYSELFIKVLNIKEGKPEVNKARVAYIENYIQPAWEDIKNYDYVIFKKKGVVYSDAIESVLAAHVSSNYIIKMDSFSYGRIARKVFNYIDVASLAIPVQRLSELQRIKGVVKISNTRTAQTFICLNHYKVFSLFISFLIILRVVYKRFSR